MLRGKPTKQSDLHLPDSRDRGSKKRKLIALLLLFLLLLALVGVVLYLTRTRPIKDRPDGPSQVVVSDGAEKPGLELDKSKKYGNKYANGLLPVGDNKYSLTGAAKGIIYNCSRFSQNNGQGGAKSRGPWFVNQNTQYDINKKAKIGGRVSWNGSFSNVKKGTMRHITTNNLPVSHTTGVFPTATDDPAYANDHTPFSLQEQTLTYLLSANPTYGDPQCVGDEVGIMLTGIPLFNAFDDEKRDAGTWEVHDKCAGHPQISGEYHYHTLSPCITDISVSTVIGFALDGFPITGPKVSEGNYLTTDDLDVCHGIKSEIILDGKKVNQYHYVMTQDFPYSVSCFRAKPSQAPPHLPDGPYLSPTPQPRP